MDDYISIIDNIREDAEDSPPIIEVVGKTSGSNTFSVVMEGNA